MRADKILVVMDGEIVEQGSHLELLRAKGKYHDLWSKQVMAKSEESDDDGASSNSIRKCDSDLINDIDPADGAADAAASCPEKPPAKSGHQREVSAKPTNVPCAATKL
jgi:ABC-type dipeptide/oligopeptide/nickel transport system ATPase component